MTKTTKKHGPTRISCAEFPRMIGQRCTFRDWIYLDANWKESVAVRLLFAPVPETQGSAKAAPFLVLRATIARVGWDVDSVEYFDSLAVAFHSLQGGAQ